MTTALAPDPIAPAALPAVRLDETGRLVPFSVYLTCTENNVEHDYDGGLVLLQQIGHQEPGVRFNGLNVAMNCVTDGDRAARTEMHAFPRTRDEARDRWFRVTIEEVDDPRPPAPAPAPDPAATYLAMLEEENAALRRQLAESVASPVSE